MARSWELHALLEDTGGRGFHLWLPLRDRVGVDAVHSCLTALCRTAGIPADGVTIEILPGPAHAPETHSQVIALPMGVHPVTQQRSRMHWLAGREVAPDLLALLDAPLNPPHQLLDRDILVRPENVPARSAPTPQSSLQPASPPASEVAAALPDWLAFAEEVHKLMTGCGLLSHLAQKARAVGHLTHAERLSVLYSLGHLGESGEQAIHAVVSPCRNYDPKETARQIAKLGGIPIGCSRLREKHAITDELRAQCGCSFSVQRLRGGYPTPLLHIDALLNLGYTLLSVEIAGRLEASGFDPRIGYYHGIRYGRQSLALDLLESHRVDDPARAASLFGSVRGCARGTGNDRGHPIRPPAHRGSSFRPSPCRTLGRSAVFRPRSR